MLGLGLLERLRGLGRVWFLSLVPIRCSAFQSQPRFLCHVALDATHYTISCLCMENNAQWAWESLGLSPQGHSLPGSIPLS